MKVIRMIPPEAILEASATIIIGILFIVTIAEAMRVRTARVVLSFSLVGIVPFSIAAILALLELTEAAKWMSIIGFALFVFWLILMSLIMVSIESDRERKRKKEQSA